MAGNAPSLLVVGFIFPALIIMYRFDLFDFLIKLLLIPALIVIGIYKLLMWFARSVVTETGSGLVKVTARFMVAVIVLTVIGVTLS
jgi:hypothetical protein